MKVNCDECKKDFEMDVKEERIKNDIVKTFFICPHCKKEYVPAIINDKVRNYQILMDKYVKEFHSNKSVGERLKLSNKIGNLKQKIDNEVASLKEIYI